MTWVVWKAGIGDNWVVNDSVYDPGGGGPCSFFPQSPGSLVPSPTRKGEFPYHAGTSCASAEKTPPRESTQVSYPPTYTNTRPLLQHRPPTACLHYYQAGHDYANTRPHHAHSHLLHAHHSHAFLNQFCPPYPHPPTCLPPRKVKGPGDSLTFHLSQVLTLASLI